MGLGSNVNVYNSCLLILQERRFQLRVEGELDSKECF